MRKHVIAYLHTHWDREWYREFEVFRLRLVRVFDNIIEMLKNNEIPCFYFDGQVSALEDYLEIRPENTEIIKKLIYAKKLYIGPFYCLVDEFLTDKKTFSKNLEIGLKKAIEFGCTDFIGYLPDTFGHSVNVPDILRDYGIDKCVVWRGCGDFPSEFTWCGMDTVNLVRGYFNNIFSMNISIEEKAELLKKELDLIAEKSGIYLLLPIGADHLGVEKDIQEQINSINEILKEDYKIKLSSPFEYFKKVGANFEKFEFNDELRDNSKTFTLQGVYSSRLDLKRWNTEASYKLDLAERFVKFLKEDENYSKIIEYAYKMLLRNEAHDSICGCSTDDVHQENIIRFKKILQISNSVIEELKFKYKFDDKMIINLSDNFYSGIVEFNSEKLHEGYERISSFKGFPEGILNDTQQIPVTEDYCDINTYLAEVKNLSPNEASYIMPEYSEGGVVIDETKIGNGALTLEIKDNKLYLNNINISLTDFKDEGDSYNNSPVENDTGKEYSIIKSKVILKNPLRSILKIDFDSEWDIVSMFVTAEKDSPCLEFKLDWNNTKKNHILYTKFELSKNIYEVFSEDMNTLIKRTFDPEYNIRENLPKEKGKEVKTNTAPMQRGLLIDEKYNNLGVVTKGLTQYEIFKNLLYIPILRATGMISNPENKARTTPAGPPLKTPDLQMIKNNTAEFYVFFGNANAFYEVVNRVYNYLIV